MLQGIDVSWAQGRFDWNTAVGWGLDFALAKASEGVGFTDAQWTRNQAALLAPGPLVGGSYHYAREDLGNSAIAEADWYLSRHDPAVFQPTTPWIFALDAEELRGSAQWCYDFLGRVGQQVGYACWFYSYQSWILSHNVRAYTNPLWIAAPSYPPGQPPNVGWAFATAHQYGLTHGVDADAFLSDRATLLILAGVVSQSPTYIGGGMLQYDPLDPTQVYDVIIGTDGGFYARKGVDTVLPDLPWIHLDTAAAPKFAPMTASITVRPDGQRYTLEAVAEDGSIWTHVRAYDGSVITDWRAKTGAAGLPKGIPGPKGDPGPPGPNTDETLRTYLRSSPS